MSNRRLGLLVLGVMLTMATIGLIFALRTVEHRRKIDKRGMEEQPPAAVDRPEVTKPSEQGGLGYLPDDTNVLLGIDVQKLRAIPAGLALLQKLDSLDDILVGPTTDTVLVGLHLKALPPRITLFARGTQPINRGRIFTKSRVERRGRTIERIALPAWNVDACVAFIDDRTVIGTQLPEDFDAVPNPPASGIDRFMHLKSILARQLDTGVIGWLIGRIEAGNAAIPMLAGVMRLPELENLRAISFAFRGDGEDLSVTLDVRGRDSAASAALAGWLDQSLRSAGVTATRTTDGDWQRLTAKLNADAVAKWFAK